jgi:hypothetical protein
VTTAKFDPGAQAPDSAKLGGKNPADYGAVSGISTASATESDVTMLSPNHDLVARDISTEVTAVDSDTGRTIYLVVNGTPEFACLFGTLIGSSCLGGNTIPIPANSRLSIRDDVGAEPGAQISPADLRVSFRLTP